MSRDVNETYKKMGIQDMVLEMLGENEASKFLSDIGKANNKYDNLNYNQVNEETKAAVGDILKSGDISATEMTHIITFIINRICQRENIKVPAIEYSFVMEDDLLNPKNNKQAVLGEFRDNVLKVCLTNVNGDLTSIYDAVETATHELYHYFAQKDLDDGILSSRAFNLMITRIFANNLSTGSYDEYKSNYSTKESEYDANRFSARQVLDFIAEFVPQNEESKVLSDQYQRKITTAYVNHSMARPKDIHGDSFRLFIYNVKNLRMIIRRRPYILDQYPMLKEFFSLEDGKVNIRLSNILGICNKVEDAYYAGAIDEDTKDSDLNMLDNFIWSCARTNKFKNYAISAESEEEKNLKCEELYYSFMRLYGKFMEATYYRNSVSSISGLFASQVLLPNIVLMVNMRNAVYANGIGREDGNDDVATMDACLEGMITYTNGIIDGLIKYLPAQAVNEYRMSLAAWKEKKDERLDDTGRK